MTSSEANPGAGDTDAIRTLGITARNRANTITGVLCPTLRNVIGELQGTTQWAGRSRDALIEFLQALVPAASAISDGLLAEADAYSVYASHIDDFKVTQMKLEGQRKDFRSDITGLLEQVNVLPGSDHSVDDYTVVVPSTRAADTPTQAEHRMQLFFSLSDAQGDLFAVEKQWDALVDQRKTADTSFVSKMSAISDSYGGGKLDKNGIPLWIDDLADPDKMKKAALDQAWALEQEIAIAGQALLSSMAAGGFANIPEAGLAEELAMAEAAGFSGAKALAVAQAAARAAAKASGSTLEDGGLSVSTARQAAITDALIQEAQANGVKISPEKVVSAWRNPDTGQVNWLETGKTGEKASGLEHILDKHEGDFARKGISVDEIPSTIQKAIEENNIVGHQGTKVPPRTVYEIEVNGKKMDLAIEIGSNGYVVSANPTSKSKFIPVGSRE